MSTPVSAPKTFCGSCVAASSEQTPGNISTFNGIGRQFYGSADVCAQCGSAVRTLWFVLVHLPLVPLGSYRYIQTGSGYNKSQFLSRKLAGIRWDQAAKTWLFGWLAGAGLITAFVLWDQYKKGR